jgi:hypothetical protein
MTYTDEQLNIIKTKIISIGSCCTFNLYKNAFFVKNYFNHNSYNKSELNKIDRGITNFFDWLLCIYPNNVRILEMDNVKIEKTLHYDNWRINKKRKTTSLQYNIEFDGNYLIKSLHDLNENINLQEDVVNKYIRRHARLINAIQTTPDLMFIYDTYLPDVDIIKINETIKHLTTHNFVIIIFDCFENDFETQYNKNDNIYRINFNVLCKLRVDHKYRMHTNNIDIEQLFNIIVNNIYTDFTIR